MAPSIKRFCAALFLATAVFPFPASSQNTGTKSDQTLEDLHAAIRGENYPRAKELADTILASGSAADRERATLAYGRILLGAGDQVGARAYLSKMRGVKFQDGNKAQALFKVYQLWLDALAGKEKVSFKSLEEILKVADQNPEATAEAADVLAILHFARKESNSAVNAAEFGLQLIKYHDIKTAYIEELLRRRLKAAKPSAPIDPTEAMFRHAESLRSKKEFQESGTVYQRVFREHSESPWSHPSGYRVGTCLLELGKTKEALAWWMEQFVAPDPAGPFRGQALLDIADFQLERQLDVDAARQALSQMDVALAQGASHSTWLELRYPLYLRMGLLAYLKNDMPEAEAWFKKAIAFAPKENFILADGQDPAEVQLPPNRVERLLAACRSTEELTPASARAGDSKVSLLLVIGDLYHHGQEFKKSAEFFDRVLKPEQVLKPIANQTAHALYRRMQCHWDAFDMKQAVALGRRFMANHPKHDKAPDVLLHCGIALYTNLEQEQAAIQCFEEVRTQYQATEEGRIALWHLAMLHKWEKRPRQSLELFELFKKLYPKDSGIEWIDSVLPELRRAP